MYVVGAIKLSTLLYWLLVIAGIPAGIFVFGVLLVIVIMLLIDLWAILTKKPTIMQEFSEGFWRIALIVGIIFVVFHFHIVEWG